MLWFMLSLCVAGFGVANLVITIIEMLYCVYLCMYIQICKYIGI